MKGNAVVSAVQHIRRMRGGAQAHLIRASDGKFYVTKFQNNPQHVRVLANEFLATNLGRVLGLPMPQVEPIEVCDWLITNTPELRIEMPDSSRPCSSGLQLASRYAADPAQEMAFDYLPEAMFPNTVNSENFARVLVFDKWAGNCDGRQAIFTKRIHGRTYRVTFIDQGYCFNAGEWTFPDLPLLGVYGKNAVYSGVTGWDSFEPTLSRAEAFDYTDLWNLASEIPEEWYRDDAEALSRLVETLYKRRLLIRDLITSFRNSHRNPFPNWS